MTPEQYEALSPEQKKKLEVAVSNFIIYGENNLTVDDIVSLEDFNFHIDKDVAKVKEDITAALADSNSVLARAYQRGVANRKIRLLNRLHEAALGGSIQALKDCIAIFCGLGKDNNDTNINVTSANLIFPQDVLPQLPQQVVDGIIIEA